MSPLFFLVTRKAKNRFREFITKPSQLILALVVLAFLGFSFYTSAVSTPSEHILRDKNEFFAIVFALYTFVFITTAKNGFSNGASMFSMADINLIFTAPVKEKRVLTFGLFQQMGKSLTLGAFILYQTSLVNNVYGLPFTAVLTVLIGYAAVIFCGQMTATVIYSLTCSDDRKATVGKILFYGIYALFGALMLLKSYMSGLSAESLVSAAREKIMYLCPVSGFISFAAEGAISGNRNAVLSGIAIFALLCISFYIILSKIKGDFYEDVLKATQISFSAITARKEGKVNETAPRNIKTGKTGLGKGFGASAITYKHKKENRRSNPFIINPVSLAMAVFSFIYCLIFSEEIIALFAINVYTMSVTVCIGRWAKEFTYPYIYLIPESNFKKLLYILKADIPLIAAESAICFIPLIFIGHYGLLETLSMMAARFTFGILFIGVNLILQRFFGESDKKIFTMLLYFIFVLVFSVPSAAVGIVAGMIFPFNYEIAFAFMSIINIAISLLLIFLCRNVLEYSEYNNR